MACVEYDDLAMFCDKCIEVIQNSETGSDMSDLMDKLCDGCKIKAERHCGVCNSDLPVSSLVSDNGCFDCRQPVGFSDRRGFFHSEAGKYLSAEEIKTANKDDDFIGLWVDSAEVGDMSRAFGTSEISLTCVDMPSIIFHSHEGIE